MTFNRKRGITYYLAHIGRSCPATAEYHCVMMRPFIWPRPYDEMIENWNADQKALLRLGKK